MSITISRSENNNLTEVQMGTTVVWFSYETPVAFIRNGVRVVCENRWSATTGRHLSAIDGGSSKTKEGRAIIAARTPRADFLALLDAWL